MSIFSISRYTREYGSAEKIQSFVDCYLKKEKECTKEEIEKLLYTDLSKFTLTAIIEYINKNPDLYLNYKTNSKNDREIKKLCNSYNTHIKTNTEPFFKKTDDIYKSINEYPAFKRIKCIWVLYELLKNKQKGDTSVKTMEELQKVNILISRKIEQLKENLFNRCAGQITVEDYKIALGINNIEELLIRDGGMGKKRATKKRKMRKLKRTQSRR